MVQEREVMGVKVQLDFEQMADDFELLELNRKVMENSAYIVDLLHYILSDAEFEAAKEACRVNGRVSTQKLSEFVLAIFDTSEPVKNS